jgi:hypothetical protein
MRSLRRDAISLFRLILRLACLRNRKLNLHKNRLSALNPNVQNPTHKPQWYDLRKSIVHAAAKRAKRPAIGTVISVPHVPTRRRETGFANTAVVTAILKQWVAKGQTIQCVVADHAIITRRMSNNPFAASCMP